MKHHSLALRQRTGLAITLLMAGYVLTEVVSEIFVRSVIPPAPALQALGKALWFSFFAFAFIPKILKLPNGETSLGRYLDAIGLRTVRPVGPLAFLVLSCYALFAASQLLGSLIHHSVHSLPFSLDFARNSLLQSRSIHSALFEEIVMRGVIVALLVQSRSRRRSIIISATVFAGIHTLNMLNPATNKLWVSAQVVWAFALGAMYAQMFIAFRSLYPPIIIHYLINALVGVWFRGLDRQDPASAGYGILFFGVVPALLAMLWIRYMARRWPEPFPADPGRRRE